MNQTSVDQAFRDQWNAARFVKIVGDKPPAGFEVGDQRRALADTIEIIDGQFDASFARDGEQMQHRIGRAAGRRNRGNGILDRFTGNDLEGRRS